MHGNRSRYYGLSLVFPVLALILCVATYNAGQIGDLQLGGYYLVSIPNYYFFYTVILPFIAAGVAYLARENPHIRFAGTLSNELNPALQHKVRRFQTLFLLVFPLLCLLVIVQDAADKDFALPPHAYQFVSEDQQQAVSRAYACAQGWVSDVCPATLDAGAYYLETLQNAGIDPAHQRGFTSLSAWWSQASWLYRYDSLLSLLAALVIAFFVAEVFLLILVKNYARTATRNLGIWLMILVSFWFPTKIYSAWSASLRDFEAPGVFFFGLALLAVGALLIFFIKTERNDLAKYGSTVTAIFSFALASVSYLKPDILHRGIGLLTDNLTFPLILLVMVALSLYLVTDYFIDSNEPDGDERDTSTAD